VLEWAHATWAVLVQVDGQLASHVGIVDREVLVDGRAIRIAGIASVMTEPEFQGRGYATAALQRATAFIHETLHVPFALLLCLEHRRTLYEGLGWRPLPGPVFCDQPDGKVLLTIPGRYIMFLPGTSEGVPVGPIDLCGLPW
jgi:GNAT superfamily N-acetyltransferase